MTDYKESLNYVTNGILTQMKYIESVYSSMSLEVFSSNAFL